MSMPIQDDWTLRRKFEGELLKDEDIRWVGRPDPSVHFTRFDIFLVPFSLFWTGFMLVALCGVTIGSFGPAKNSGDALFPLLFGVPFLIIGSYVTFGRFIYKAWKKRHTHYAVTNKRVIVLTETRSRSVDAAFVRDIPTLSKSGKRGRTGTVVFGRAGGMASMYSNTGMDFLGSYYGPTAPTFYDIRDAEHVYELVNNLRNER